MHYIGLQLVCNTYIFIILVLTYSLTHIISTIIFLFNYNLSKKASSSDNEASAAKSLRINILSHGLNSSLNRTQVSSTNATLVLSEMSPNFGHELSPLNVNQNSIQ